MDHEVREVITVQTIIIAFTAMVASLIPAIGPGLLAYFFAKLNDRMCFLTKKHAISSFVLGYVIVSVIICILGQPVKLSVLLFTLNTFSSLIFFFLSLFIEKKRNNKSSKELLKPEMAK